MCTRISGMSMDLYEGKISQQNFGRRLRRFHASSRCEMKIRARDPVKRGSDDGWRTVGRRLRNRDVSTCSSTVLWRTAVTYDSVRVKGSVNSMLRTHEEVRNYGTNGNSNVNEIQVNSRAKKKRKKKKKWMKKKMQ